MSFIFNVLIILLLNRIVYFFYIVVSFFYIFKIEIGIIYLINR